MEKKNTIICIIFVAVLVISAGAYIVFTGITADEYNYVQLEINPRVEFLCDKYFNVVSYKGLNEDAEILLSNVEYKGMKMEDVAIDFIDTCARTGYIDVNGVNNAINVTVIDGLTQALDVHIVKKINSYLKEKEILCSVTESNEDRFLFDDKKELGVCCANKLKLITTLNEQDSTLEIEKLKTLSEVELIDMVANIHATTNKTIDNEKSKYKQKLIAHEQAKYQKHINSISKETQKEFAKIFEDYTNSSTEKYKTNFRKEYSIWQNSYIS